jgi:hypothetical protein
MWGVGGRNSKGIIAKFNLGEKGRRDQHTQNGNVMSKFFLLRNKSRLK